MIASTLALAVMGAALPVVPPAPVPPRPAPAAFVTAEKGLTFRTPPRATYCPLPADWTGSDHGTVVFLRQPRACAGGTGYPSSARGFQPADAPRIELFYAYWMGEDEPSPPPCHRVGRQALLGRTAALCRERHGRAVTVTARARYRADEEIGASFTLVTTPAREGDDLQAFRAVLQSARTCSSVWHGEDAHGRRAGPDGVIGIGPRCPADARFF